MRYAIWNNKGGVGKSFLSFMLATEVAKNSPGQHVILADMCPQANVSEMVLGGNSKGSANLEKLLADGKDRKTVGGYFDTRITSPHKPTTDETSYLISAKEYNAQMPANLWLLAGDPSLEIQAQVINQISGQTLPEDAWKSVHCWLKDLITSCVQKLGTNKTVTVFIDCNPSFSAYTELAMIAAERLILPCSSDGSSARAINNVGALLYGMGPAALHASVGFHSKASTFKLPLPLIHSVLLNRSTQYNKTASKAFGAMFEAIKAEVERLRQDGPQHFTSGSSLFCEIPDNHSVAIVCSHLGKPLYDMTPGKYPVHEETPQVNDEPLERYKTALKTLRETL